jgi:anti-anti-sigma factor
MEITGDVDPDGVLTLVVRDHGTWRPPDRDPGDRGRGLLIMRQLVDRVLLKGEAGTTVTLSMQLRHGPEVEEDHLPTDAAATVVVDRSAERPLVLVDGVVDLVSAEVLRIRLLEASRGGTTPVDLDLTDVTLFSSAAVRVVLAIARIGREEDWRLGVRVPEGSVTRHVLEISGLAALVQLL